MGTYRSGFYLAVLVYAFLLHPELELKEKLMPILVNFSFMQTIFSRYELAGHFWSIAVEWQFYMVFPFLVYLGGWLKNFNYALLVFSLLITFVGIRMLMIDARFDLLLPARFLQFAAGLYMAKWFINYSLKNNYMGWKPLVCGILLMGVGRILNSAELLYLYSSAWYYAIVKVTGYCLLAFGFSILMTVSLKDRSWWYSFLDSRTLARIGEISYSFYLWHGIVCMLVWRFTHTYFGHYLFLGAITVFLVSAVISSGIAMLSFKMVEQKLTDRWLR